MKIRTARSTDPTCLPCQARVQEVAAATPSVRGYEDREPEPCRAGPVAPRPAAECRDGPAAPASIAACAHVCRLPTRGVVRRGGLGVTRRAATPRRPSPRPACPTGHLLPVLQALPSGDPKEGPLKEDLVLEGKSCSPNLTDYPVSQDQNLPSGHPDTLSRWTMTGSAGSRPLASPGSRGSPLPTGCCRGPCGLGEAEAGCARLGRAQARAARLPAQVPYRRLVPSDGSAHACLERARGPWERIPPSSLPESPAWAGLGGAALTPSRAPGGSPPKKAECVRAQDSSPVRAVEKEPRAVSQAAPRRRRGHLLGLVLAGTGTRCSWRERRRRSSHALPTSTGSGAAGGSGSPARTGQRGGLSPAGAVPRGGSTAGVAQGPPLVSRRPGQERAGAEGPVSRSGAEAQCPSTG